MDQSILEKTVSLPQLFVTLSCLYIGVETFRNYRSISKDLEKTAREKGMEIVKKAVRGEMESLRQRGWFYRNIINAGVVMAYERFLRRGE